MSRNRAVSLVVPCIAAVTASGLAFLATLVLILEFKYPKLENVGFADFHPLTVAVAFCILLGAVFAFLWPAVWGRLAALSSSMFWGFFVVVFLCLLFNGQVDWVPLGQAVLTIAGALGGALAGRWLSGKLWSRPAA